MEEELNRHGNEWLKAMNRDRIYRMERQRNQNPERRMKDREKDSKEKSKEDRGPSLRKETSRIRELNGFKPSQRGSI